MAENYVDFPPLKLFKLPCSFLFHRADGTFAAVEEQPGVVNIKYAITPLGSDFNQDGYSDLIYVNIDGNMQAHINNGGDHHFLRIRFPGNADYAGARVTVTLAAGNILSDTYTIGEGLSSDQTATLNFGLGKAVSVQSVNIVFPSGKEKAIENPAIDKVHLITI